MKVELKCGHSHRVPENDVDKVSFWCSWCGGYKERIPRGWSFKCQDCRYARELGAAPLSTRTLATGHSLRLHHTVHVYSEHELVDVVKPDQPMLPLNFDGDPPF